MDETFLLGLTGRDWLMICAVLIIIAGIIGLGRSGPRK